MAMAWIYAMLGDQARAAENARLAFDNLAHPDRQTVFEATMKLIMGHYVGDRTATEAALDDATRGGTTDIGFNTYIAFASVVWAEAALAIDRTDLALRIAEYAVAEMDSKRVRTWRPDVLRVKAQALLADGRVGEARSALTEAAAQAQAIGSRRALWEAAAALGQLEQDAGNADAARAARAQARDAIAYIAEHTGSAELRESFLRRSEVQAAMDG